MSMCTCHKEEDTSLHSCQWPTKNHKNKTHNGNKYTNKVVLTKYRMKINSSPRGNKSSFWAHFHSHTGSPRGADPSLYSLGLCDAAHGMLSLSLCLCVCLSLRLSVSLSVSLRLSPSLSLSISLSLSLPFSTVMYGGDRHVVG